MADEFDLEQEVARLRGKLKALTVITVLFMLASGGLAAAVYMKVSKTPEAPSELRLSNGSTGQMAVLTPAGLELSNGADRALYRLDAVELKMESGSARLQPRLLHLEGKNGSVMLDGTASSTNLVTRPESVLTPFSLALVHGDRKAVMDVVDDPPKLVLTVPGKDDARLAPEPPPPPPPPAPVPAPAPP